MFCANGVFKCGWISMLKMNAAIVCTVSLLVLVSTSPAFSPILVEFPNFSKEFIVIMEWCNVDQHSWYGGCINCVIVLPSNRTEALVTHAALFALTFPQTNKHNLYVFPDKKRDAIILMKFIHRAI